MSKLRCAVGWHDWCTDASLIASYRRCNRCYHVDDVRAFERTVAERERIRRLPKGATIAQVYLAALDIHPRIPYTVVKPDDRPTP